VPLDREVLAGQAVQARPRGVIQEKAAEHTLLGQQGRVYGAAHAALAPAGRRR
jgi:hypothetical protein